VKPLSDGYLAEVDSLGRNAWYTHISGFSDASLYQLWQNDGDADRFCVGSRLVLKRLDAVVAAAEVRLFRVPWAQCGIAHVRWGPVRNADSGAADPEIFRQTVRALRNEYVRRRGMVLRLVPRLFVEQDQECLQILVDEGFSQVRHAGATKSLVVDLSPDLNDLRRGFKKCWRTCLNKAEKGNLSLTAGTDLPLFDEFIAVYDRMLRRKRFFPMTDIHRHRRLQEALPDPLKMGVVLARHEGVPCAGAVYSAIGQTAVYLFGATDEVGRRTSGSYLVQWHVIQALKERGCTQYDLNGADPKSNPGTYHFKRGLAGRNGREVSFLGHFQAFDASVGNQALLLIDRLRFGMRMVRSRWRRQLAARVAGKLLSTSPILTDPSLTALVGSSSLIVG
jgi:hypothetical protein